MTSHARFSIIPAWAVTDRRLKPRDLQVLCLLGRHTDRQGWCRRSQVKMAGELDCARSTVQAAIDRLADIGLVEKHVEETASGADSAHYYRVIFDRPPPSGYAFDAWGGDDGEEDNPIEPGENAYPPADISAPPADPEPAPPAGPEPAPINDPSLTSPVERRERARESETGDRKESREAIRRAFNKWYRLWPVNSSIPHTAEDAWFELGRDERLECIERTADYIAWCGGAKKISTYAAVYLRERLWTRLPARVPPPARPMPVKSFGRASMAFRFAEFTAPPRPLPPLTATLQRLVDEGGDKAANIMRQHRERYGWPAVTAHDDKIRAFEPITLPQRYEALGANFEPVARGSREWGLWERLRIERGWPPLPASDRQEWFQFPPLPPVWVTVDGDEMAVVRAAWREFERKVNGDADAA